MSKPWPESRGKSLDIAVTDAWTFGAGALWFWLAGHPAWWVALVAVLVLGASTYALRRLRSWRRRKHHWIEVIHTPGGSVQVESDDPAVVAQVRQRMSEQATEAIRRRP